MQVACAMVATSGSFAREGRISFPLLEGRGVGSGEEAAWNSVGKGSHKKSYLWQSLGIPSQTTGVYLVGDSCFQQAGRA